MDILGILKESGQNLTEEELDSYHRLLKTGTFDKKTVAECEELLCVLRQTRLLAKQRAAQKPVAEKPRQENPEQQAKPTAHLDYKKIVTDYLDKTRNASDFKSQFRKYIAESSFFREDFIGENITIFNEVELEVIVTVISLSEAFLEKFFKSFDPEKISRYQEFSEEFFIKHINELNVDVVLKEGKNSWRRKGAMSSKLSMMLRLKGVKL